MGSALPLFGIEFKFISLVVLIAALAWLLRRMGGASYQPTTLRGPQDIGQVNDTREAPTA